MSDRPVRGTPLRVWLAMLAGLFCLCAQALPQPLELDKLHRLTAAEASVIAVLKGFDTVKKETVYELLVANVSTTALHAPLYVTVEGLNKPGVTLKNPSGVTTSGVPYFVISAADVPAGAKVTLPIFFSNPLNVPFTFTTVGYATPQTQVPALQVEITQPPTLITVGSTPLPVAGTINDASATLTLNGAPISHSGGTFHANVALVEGHNAIIARAVNSRGEEATATISVSLDMTPPYVTIESPVDGAVLSEGVINVSGLINDIVRGTVSEGQAQVTVNGRPATVANRSYLAQGIALTEGPNTILVEASDQVGNTGTTQIHVTYVVPTGAHLELVSGQGQHAQIRTELAQPLAVKLLDTNSQPVTGKPVVFRVSQDDGVVGAGRNDEGPAVLVNTDGNGIASTRYRLGARAGSGNQHVTAKAVGFEGEVVFVASATPKPGNKVSVNSGNNQRGSPSQPLPLPFVVVVTDDGANVIEGSQVQFVVTAGSGAFQNGENHITATTDSDGRASAKLTLGGTLGLDVHRVNATLLGTQLHAGFTASALQSGAPGATSISGVVLDNQDHPLPNVTLRVEGTTREAKTDAQGRFKITEAPVGPVHLIADGSTTTAPGEWPTLPYNIVTVPGADNPLPAPVYLVKLDTEHAVTVGAEDKEITLPEVPGFKLTVKAGSVTFPNSDRVGQLSVTPVNVSKIPMAPPNGMQPQFIVTIQPAGARFDPPAPLQLPNVDGHAPGAQVEMYSFDHDLEEFVSIGLGTVSADGTTIASNPGIGVIKAGWHCGSQPGGSGCTESCGPCGEVNAQCVCVRTPVGLLAARGLLSQCSDQCPIDTDTPNDCQKPACDGSNPITLPDPNDPPLDTTAHDCKKPQCFSTELANDDNDFPEDACKTCQDGSVIDGQITDIVVRANGSRDEQWVVQTDELVAGVSVHFEASVTANRCEHVKYEWDFDDNGNRGSGPVLDHVFTSGGAEHRVKVTATCEDCPGMEPEVATIKVVVIVFFRTPEIDLPTGPTRLDLGVGEVVTFNVFPAMPGVTFELLDPATGKLEGGDSTFTFTAPDRASTATLRLSSPRFPTISTTYHVFEPTAISFRKTRELPILGSNRAGAGMAEDGVLHAIDLDGVEHVVSFVNLAVQDKSVGPSDLQGFFADRANDGVVIASGSIGAASNVFESNLLRKEVLVLVDGAIVEGPATWASGSFFFEIPWTYIVLGSASPPVEFTRVLRHISMEGPGAPQGIALGTVHIFEETNHPSTPPLPCVTRAPDDPDNLSRPCP